MVEAVSWLREYKMNSKICILGSTGFVGRALYDAFKEENYSLIGTSRTDTSNERTVVDLNDPVKLANILNESEVVINTLGSFKPNDFLEDQNGPFEALNKIANSIRLSMGESNVKRFIHVSSAGTVYGEYRGAKFKEHDLTLPDTWYGRMKVIEEYIYQQICRDLDIEYVCVRLTNPFGNIKNPKHGYVDVLASSIMKKTHFESYAEKNNERDFIYMGDVAEIVKKLINFKLESKSEVFNVGSGISTSLYELAFNVNKRTGNIKFIDRSNANDINVVAIDNSKVNSVMPNEWIYTTPNEYLENIINGIKDEQCV